MCTPPGPDPSVVTKSPPGLSRMSWLLASRFDHLAGKHKFGNRAHRGAVVHGRALDPAERLGLAEAGRGQERPLRPFDALSGLEPLTEVAHLGLQRAHLGESA